MSDAIFSQLQSEESVKIEKEGKSICLTRIGDEVFAIDDTCTHADASLSEGEVSDFKVECWLHGAEFDLRTGEATMPAVTPIHIYPVTIDGDSVTVEIA